MRGLRATMTTCRTATSRLYPIFRGRIGSRGIFRFIHQGRVMREEQAQKVEEATPEANEPEINMPSTPKDYSPKVLQVAEDIMQLNVYESIQLMECLKEKFGITSDQELMGMAGMGGFSPAMAMPMAAVPAAAPAETPTAQAAPAEEEKPAEKTEFAVKLKGFDAKGKIKVIKEIRAITGQGLKEAKETVEGVPVIIKEHLTKDEAEAMAEKIKAAGGEVELE